MTVPPHPVARAIAHGLGACALIGITMLLVVTIPGVRSSAGALAMVGGIGLLTAIGAMLAARRTPWAANDNDPWPAPRFELDNGVPTEDGRIPAAR